MEEEFTSHNAAVQHNALRSLNVHVQLPGKFNRATEPPCVSARTSESGLPRADRRDTSHRNLTRILARWSRLTRSPRVDNRQLFPTQLTQQHSLPRTPCSMQLCSNYSNYAPSRRELTTGRCHSTSAPQYRIERKKRTASAETLAQFEQAEALRELVLIFDTSRGKKGAYGGLGHDTREAQEQSSKPSIVS